MPTYLITAPDGRKFKVTGQGSKEDALAFVQSRQQPARDPSEYDSSSPEYQAKYGPLAGMSTTDKVLAGAGRSFVELGRGVKQAFGGEVDVAENRRLDAPLTESTAGKVGGVVGGVAATAPALAVPGVNTVAGAGLLGAAYGAAQPVAEDESRLGNTAIGGAFGAAGQAIGAKIAQFAGRALTQRAATAQANQAEHAVRDATLREARKAGYVVPPSMVRPSAGNFALESAGGKAATAMQAAAKNQATTNRLARDALGLPKDAPLTKTTLNAVRSRAGKVYQAIQDTGEIITDQQFLDDLTNIAAAVDDIAKDFPDADIGGSQQIDKLVSSVLRDRFSAKGAIAYLKELRKAASDNLSFAAAADPNRRALGHAQKEAASAIEDMIERHLQSSGKGALAKEFSEARELIAKSYSVQSALNPATGNVVATQLGSQLKRGRPLSGELETAAKFAAAFPPAAREITQSVGTYALDAALGAGGTLAGAPQMLALPAARVGARATILSRPYQNAFATPAYAPGATGNALLQASGAAGRRLPAPAIVLAPYAEEQ